MTEGEFIKFYKKRNKNKNHEEVKKEIDRFWATLLKALNENGPVTFKNWGTFEKKVVKSRKVITPKIEKTIYTEPKEVIRFKAGKGMKDLMIKGSDSHE